MAALETEYCNMDRSEEEGRHLCGGVRGKHAPDQKRARTVLRDGDRNSDESVAAFPERDRWIDKVIM